MKPKQESRGMAVRAVAKVGSKGRLYVPPEVRKALKISEGDYLAFREDRGRVYIEKVV